MNIEAAWINCSICDYVSKLSISVLNRAYDNENLMSKRLKESLDNGTQAVSQSVSQFCIDKRLSGV